MKNPKIKDSEIKNNEIIKDEIKRYKIKNDEIKNYEIIKKDEIKKIKIKKQVGSGDVISASIDLVDSLISFGNSVFTEINYITDIKGQMAEGASAKQGVPNVIEGPPKFNDPILPPRTRPEKIYS
jgi:hypothetical protein